MGRIDADTLYGTLKMLILHTLRSGPMHGLGVSRRIRDETGDRLQVEEGALYPALHRLERDGLLRAEWGVSDTNRRARFYDLTDAGRVELEQEVVNWTQHTELLAKVLGVSWS